MHSQDICLYRSLLVFVNRHWPMLIARMRFYKIFRRRLHLAHPEDLNEKILWLSLFSDTTMWSRCADKYAVRSYVEEVGLGNILVPLYGMWNTVEEIEWDSLPKQFVIKTNNSCGTVLVVRDKERLDVAMAKMTISNWLKEDRFSGTTEHHYQRIVPSIIAEKMLAPTAEEERHTTSMIDYKVWCFHGKADSIWVCVNRDGNKADVALFDLDWNYRPEASVFGGHFNRQDCLVPKPACLREMIRIAEKLSTPFPQVRVDLYVEEGQVYFGELTFTSGGGNMNYFTREELLRMGRKVRLPIRMRGH